MDSRALVIVRAYGGRPLRRAVLKASKKAVFVSNPASDKGGSVGFPIRDVFSFDARLFDTLERAFNANGTVPQTLWDRAVLLEIP